MRLERFVSFFRDVFARVLKCVREGSVSDIVEQGGKYCGVGAGLIEFAADVAYGDFATDSLNKLARTVEDSNGVGEARVCCRGKHKLDLSELRDAAQPLKIGGLQESPGGFIGGDFRLEIDDSVYGVLDSLVSCHCSAYWCINALRV